MKPGTKETLIFLYLALGAETYAQRLAETSFPSAAAAMYGGLFAVLLACLVLAAYIRSGVVRWLLAAILFAGAVFLDSYSRITGEFLLYDSFLTLVNSSFFMVDALAQFLKPIGIALGGGVLLLLGLGLKPAKRPPVPEFVFVYAPIAGILLLSLIMYSRGGDGGRALPASFAPLAYFGLYAYEIVTSVVGKRHDVSLSRAPVEMRRDIVLIIDESIAANYLDINSPRGVASGLATPHPRALVYNFGYAAAISNCSDGANVTLRFGGTRSDYLRMISTMPSAWHYAKNAGLQTVYLDAQRVNGKLQNLMTPEELRRVDRFIQFDKIPVRDRDMAVADMLADLINNEVPEFILVNKIGAHFPVHDKYPDELLLHQPALPRGRFVEVGDIAFGGLFGGSPEEWIQYRNSYRNTLAWNVGVFFTRLFHRADLDRATIIYTSDHGQNLHDNATRRTLHCSRTDPVMEEGVVPLVVIEGRASSTLPWQDGVLANWSKASHYNIFPTLLTLMAYDDTEIRATYGDPLHTPVKDDLTFNYRFFARLGMKPAWKRIHVDRVVAPPPSDGEFNAAATAEAIRMLR